MRDIVLVGGGHSHALVLKAWAMDPLEGVRLTLINPAPTAPYSGMLPGFVAGHYGSDKMQIDLARLARAANARLVLGTVGHIDRRTQRIIVAGRPPIGYDLCALDIGITSDLPEIEGFSSHGVPAKPLGSFAQTWETFCTETGTKHLAILGAGVAGAELALAAAYRLRGRDRSGQITLIDSSDALSRLGSKARALMLAQLSQHGVTLIEKAQITRVTSQNVQLSDGQIISSDLTIGAAGSRAQGWLTHLELPLTNGHINVTPTLQSPEDPRVFATGDCAHMIETPRPKAGVFAVRQAPVLMHNLRAALLDKPLRAYRPQRDYLKLISLGTRRAMAEKAGLALSGPLMWRWKDSIDRRFMRQFAELTPMAPPPLPKAPLPGLPELSAPICAGCGAKVGRAALSHVLFSKPPHTTQRNDIQPLPGDDAALLKIGEQRQVISTDHLRAFNSDPVTMARIAAVHALGDIWAMGADPQAALATLILPRMSAPMQERWLEEIMPAAEEVITQAGAEIIGGHTSLGAEFTTGFTVTGLAPRAPITLAGARAGDALLLTKPVGTGVLLAGDMQLRTRGADLSSALFSMSRPLKRDSELLRDAAHAMTDVTGFGLAGHLAGFCRASNLGARLEAHNVPLLPGALDLSESGIASTLYPDNLADLQGMMAAPRTARGRLMLDPQTAGGLLAAVAPDQAEGVLRSLRAEGINAACIGEMTDKAGQLDLIE